MSIAVTLDELPGLLAEFSWGYLLTVADDGRPRVRAVPTVWDGVALVCRTGDGARGNVGPRPNVTMVFPPADHVGMSLIVDADAVALDDGVRLTPTSAVLHRSALR
jgi:hypothetical protein